MSKRVLTKDEKDMIEPLIEKIKTAQAAFVEASSMLDNSKKYLWDKLRKCYPEVVNVSHPDEGDWTITIFDLKE